MTKSFVKKLDSGGYEGDLGKAFKEAGKPAMRRSTSSGFMPQRATRGTRMAAVQKKTDAPKVGERRSSSDRPSHDA